MQKLSAFNDINEAIVFLKQKNNWIYVITQYVQADYLGKIKEATFWGYKLDSLSLCSVKPKHFIKMEINALYSGNLDNEYLNGLCICDFTEDKYMRDSGCGSIMMEQLILYAKTLDVTHISGKLSFVDIGSAGNRTKEQLNNRERLYHFYQKFGFVIDEKEHIRLDIKENR